jgi:hypothetical protein
MRNVGLLVLAGILALGGIVTYIMMLHNVSEERDAFWTAFFWGPLTPKRCLTHRGLIQKRCSIVLGAATIAVLFVWGLLTP